MRCYFNLVSDGETIPDDEGVDVADIESAHAQALAAIDELLRSDPASEEEWEGWSLEVVDGSGRSLLVIPLVEPREPAVRMRLVH